jgi:hypothetical protein
MVWFAALPVFKIFAVGTAAVVSYFQRRKLAKLVAKAASAASQCAAVVKAAVKSTGRELLSVGGALWQAVQSATLRMAQRARGAAKAGYAFACSLIAAYRVAARVSKPVITLQWIVRAAEMSALSEPYLKAVPRIRDSVPALAA